MQFLFIIIKEDINNNIADKKFILSPVISIEITKIREKINLIILKNIYLKIKILDNYKK